MNSANSVTTNNTRKIHNDQYPRRLVAKFCQRLLLSGDSAKRLGCGSTPSGPVGSASGIGRSAAGAGLLSLPRGWVLTSTSHLSGFKVDAWVDPRVGEVGDQAHDQSDQRKYVKIGEDHRIIAVEYALETEQTESVQREDRLDQQRAGEEGADEGARKAGDHYQHGIAEDVAVQHLAFRAALGARGQHVLLAQLFQERVFGQKRRRGEGGKRHRHDRQGQVPEIIEDFFPPRKLRPAVGGQSAQREDIEERAAGKQDDEQDREQESGDRVADDDHTGRPHVELRAVAHGLADAERYRNQITEQRHPDPERDRDRQLLPDELQDADVAEIALAEVEAHVVPQHEEKALI